HDKRRFRSCYNRAHDSKWTDQPVTSSNEHHDEFKLADLRNWARPDCASPGTPISLDASSPNNLRGNGSGIGCSIHPSEWRVRYSYWRKHLLQHAPYSGDGSVC